MSEVDAPTATARPTLPGLWGRLQGGLIRGIAAICWLLGGFALVVLVVALLVGVADRFVMKLGLAWPEELGRLCLVWLTLMGATIAAAHGRHFAVVLTEGPAGDDAFHLLRDLMVAVVTFALAVFLLMQGWDMADIVGGQTMAAFDISVLWFYAPFIGFAASLVLFEAFSVAAIATGLASRLRAGAGVP